MSLSRVIGEEAFEFACAWLDDEAVGYTQTRFYNSIWYSGVVAYLDDLFVFESARGKNLGRQLLRHALSRARERGAKQLALTTNEHNVAAQGLYRSEGMVPETHALWSEGREIKWVIDLE